MAKYRIKPAAAEIAPEHYPPAEYWREVQPGQARDLDLSEIAELNRQAELAEAAGEGADEPALIRPFRRIWLRAALALLALTGFFFLITADALRANIDFSFLSRSAELKQDESLAALQQAVVMIETPGASGTGFNIRPDGLIVTNKHVVENGGIITVSFSQGGQKVFTSRDFTPLPDVDIALIDISGDDLPAVELNAALPAAGDSVVFIGNPLGFDWTISTGSVLGLADLGGLPVIVLEGPVRPGSSGSPLFNSQAEVIGVIFATLRDVEDSGLAIPISYLINYLEESYEQ